MTRSSTKPRRVLSVAFLVLLSLAWLPCTSCGTLLYPERRGQTEGRVDPAVVILDGLGLFFFLIPGIVAFAVDFSTGAIYLPPGEKSDLTKEEGASD